MVDSTRFGGDYIKIHVTGVFPPRPLRDVALQGLHIAHNTSIFSLKCHRRKLCKTRLSCTTELPSKILRSYKNKPKGS
jgi:hypothetical protein